MDPVNPSYVNNLRFSLDILEAKSHLGLDAQYASQLRAIIQKQIARAEDVRQLLQ